MARRWQAREVSNLEYLIYINRKANRSHNDLSQ